MGEGVNLMDVEELGPALRRQQAKSSALVPEVRDMITPALRQALTKQGYKLLGTHSGVKMCRWTKVVFFHISSKIKCNNCNKKKNVSGCCTFLHKFLS